MHEGLEKTDKEGRMEKDRRGFREQGRREKGLQLEGGGKGVNDDAESSSVAGGGRAEGIPTTGVL